VAIPTEPIGSIPRPPELLSAMAARDRGEIGDTELARAVDQAVRDTIQRLEQTGSPVVTDGEQSRPSFATYPLAGLKELAPDGVIIPFADGHQRQLPVLTGGPFRYGVHAVTQLRHATAPVKQAVIAPSALSLLYPADGLPGYGREAFLADLLDEAEADIRGALDAGAHVVQLDFTEGRLSLKLDPSGAVLDDFIALDNQLLERFTGAERSRIGVHTCPGGDYDSTHSLDVDYAGFLPKLFQLQAGNFYVQLASEADPDRVLSIIAEHLPASARGWRPPARFVTGPWRRPASCRRTGSAPATIAASHRSLTIPLPRARPRSRRSARGLRGLPSRRRLSDCDLGKYPADRKAPSCPT
jgi:5-methyltetrahydropteroyltriglutamate--homocysteine methyltransferase